MNPQEKSPETAKPEAAKKETTIPVEAVVAKEPEVKIQAESPITDSVSPAALATTTETATNSTDEVLSEVSEYLKKLSQSVSNLFNGEQKSTLTIVALALLTIPLLLVISGTLNFIDSVPLLSPLLELVGLGYTLWFIYRYLLFVHTRQELTSNIKEFKQKILG